MQNLDIIIQFAMLWGETIGSATTAAEWDEAKIMKEYDSEDLQEMCKKPTPLGVGWIAQIMCM